MATGGPDPTIPLNVLTEKTWTPESVFRLLLMIVLSLAVMGMVSVGAERLLPCEVHPHMQTYVGVAATVVFQVVVLGLVNWFLRINATNWAGAFGITGQGTWTMTGWAVVTTLGVFPVNLALLWISQKAMLWRSMEVVAQPTVEALRGASGPAPHLLLGLMAIFLAPLVEEILFRGILYPSIKQVGWPRLALWSTSLFFAATHANLVTFLPLTFLAVVLALLYEYTGNLLAPILTHSLFNAMNFVWLVFEGHAG